MDKHQIEALAEIPESCQGIVKRAFEKTTPPRAAIKAKCLECCGYVRADITACVATRCPLHAYRPFQP